MKILVLNAGSSSQKSCLYELTNCLPPSPPQPQWQAKLSWQTPENTVELTVKDAQGNPGLQTELNQVSRPEALREMLQTLWQGETQVMDQPQTIDWVGHRVVHGGQYQQPTAITPAVKTAISQLAALAPAHNPANLEGIEVVEELLGAVPQTAVFDTAFHSQLPAAAAIYPGPYDWVKQGIRRYGFHGINHEYCAQRTAQLLDREIADLRLITCHLGNGCSLAAIADGHSIDTTMGFTPLEGLMMGSRSGSIDPGIVIHLVRQGYAADRLDQVLNHQSGLLGISGISNDMREIQAAIGQGQDRAILAFEIYIHRLRAQIGAMLASLRGHIDGLVFTGGIGENDPQVRVAACEAFGFLGLKLDRDRNQRSPVDIDIATPDSSVRVLVIQAQEDWAIAQACWKLAQSCQSG